MDKRVSVDAFNRSRGPVEYGVRRTYGIPSGVNEHRADTFTWRQRCVSHRLMQSSWCEFCRGQESFQGGVCSPLQDRQSLFQGGHKICSGLRRIVEWFESLGPIFRDELLNSLFSSHQSFLAGSGERHPLLELFERFLQREIAAFQRLNEAL